MKSNQIADLVFVSLTDSLEVPVEGWYTCKRDLGFPCVLVTFGYGSTEGRQVNYNCLFFFRIIVWAT